MITGLGVISSNGIGKDAFSEAIFKGVSGIRPISLFDASGFKTKTAGEIKDFRPQNFLGDKGLRLLDRSTKLVSSATKLALGDAGLDITEDNTHSTGVVIGTTLGSIQSITDFDKEAIKEGVRYVNPSLFPNTVINSPASQVSIKFDIKGFNTTISTGFSASLDAVNYAVNFIKLGRADVVLAGGVEELCIQTFLGFYKTGFLAGLNNGSFELSCPFDRRRNGIIFGEGACVLVLENLESAINRKADIYAEVLGSGMGFEPYRINKYKLKGQGLKRAMQLALKNANLSSRDIDCICSAANSTRDGDFIETMAIKDVFAGGTLDRLPVSAIKSMIGECFSASGALQLAAAVCAMEKPMVFPTINYQEKDPQCDLNYVTNKAKSAKVNNVLINAFGPSGCNSSLIISKFTA